MYCLPLWLVKLETFIAAYIWHPPEALQFMFLVYHIDLLTDMVLLAKAKELTVRLAFRKVAKVMGSCMLVSALLYVGTGAAKYSGGFSWLPHTLFFMILAGLILLIVGRAAKLGVLNPLVAQVLEIRITSLINTHKNNDLEGNKDGSPLPAERTTKAA